MATIMADSHAALAAQIGGLREQLATLQATVAERSVQLDTTTGLIVGLVGQDEPAPAIAPVWVGLTNEEHAAQTGRLQAWVTTHLEHVYGPYSREFSGPAGNSTRWPSTSSGTSGPSISGSTSGTSLCSPLR